MQWAEELSFPTSDQQLFLVHYQQFLLHGSRVYLNDEELKGVKLTILIILR